MLAVGEVPQRRCWLWIRFLAPPLDSFRLDALDFALSRHLSFLTSVLVPTPSAVLPERMEINNEDVYISLCRSCLKYGNTEVSCCRCRSQHTGTWWIHPARRIPKSASCSPHLSSKIGRSNISPTWKPNSCSKQTRVHTSIGRPVGGMFPRQAPGPSLYCGKPQVTRYFHLPPRSPVCFESCSQKTYLAPSLPLELHIHTVSQPSLLEGMWLLDSSFTWI